MPLGLSSLSTAEWLWLQWKIIIVLSIRWTDKKGTLYCKSIHRTFWLHTVCFNKSQEVILRRFESFQVILNNFESFWVILSHFESFWVILSHVESFWVISSHFQLFPVFSSHFESFQVISSHFKSFRVISSHFESWGKISNVFCNTLSPFLPNQNIKPQTL